MKKLISMLSASVLVVGMLGVSAGTALADNPATNCITSNDISSGYTWTRSSTNLNGASLDVVARALEPCWNGTSTKPSKSFLLVSIEAKDNAGYDEFPQLGLCKMRYAEDQTRFCWVSPESGGFTNVLNTGLYPDPLIDEPVAGHVYRFTITVANYQSKWQFKYNITDTTNSDVIVNFYRPFAHQPGLYGDLNGVAWYGCETGTDANALGTLYGGARAYMSRAGYKVGSTWNYTQNSTLVAGPGLWTKYADQHYGQTQNGMYNSDSVYCYTQ